MSFNLPTETIELPSKGLLYPEGHPLSDGTIEIKYMTAKEEDILTNQNYISNGTVLDKLLKSLSIKLELPDRYDSSDLDKICKEVSKMGVVCDHGDYMDVS